ncbi:NB-ARC domain-containing protein [Spirulina sp. CS-785/01]|uniref:helix-turn-helix domain-containing protein n=1 Tax=Spirulina sp. CS-785/01 TaxID=3021716 RepID=UPI00232A7B6F|nr:XRE family transcriptional regulator [Spirulina sp. CS-785/01]MDB9312820.1 NB-ARC domain-containing protein [Spirulina sp. CS-785/01]
MSTLKASKLGLMRIQQARKERGWSWNAEDDTCLVEASEILEPDRPCPAGGPYAYGVSLGTWKRFLAGKHPIGAKTFQAYCQALGLPWEEIVDRRCLSLSHTRQDWDEEIDVSQFFGRVTELQQLEQWIISDRCRLILLSGMGGMGKTALSMKLGRQVQDQFEYVIRRSLRHSPPILPLLEELNQFLTDDPHQSLPNTPEGQIARLIDFLRDHRCLILLDDLEAILWQGELAGQYQSEYQGYGELICRIGREYHQSCLLAIAREKPRDISSLEGEHLPIREMKLRGLEFTEAQKILTTQGFPAEQPGVHQLIQLYRGHPLALKLMATTIRDIFGGEIYDFLDQSTLVLGDIMPTIFYQHFERLSKLEKSIVYWLALEEKPLTLSMLRKYLQFSVSSSSEIVAALESLKRRALLEVIKPDGTTQFTLEPVFMKYIVNQLIEKFYEDIDNILSKPSIQSLGLLKSHCFVQKEDPETRRPPLVLSKIKERLYMVSGIPDAFDLQIQETLEQLKEKSSKEIGYTKINLKALLSQS